MAFLGVPIVAGEITRRRVPIGQYLDGSDVAIPVLTLGGSRAGPVLFIQAAIHGDESTGVEVARRFLADLDHLGDFSGTVVAVPVANVPSHVTRTRGFLHEERWLLDINRMWPGSPDGLLTERVADTLFTQFICQADLTIDLHSALDGCTIAPFVYLDPDDDDQSTLEIRRTAAYAFGTPYIYHKERGTMFGRSDLTRSLATQADRAAAPMVLAEMGESRRVSDEFVELGRRGLHNVMKALQMVEGDPDLPDEEPRHFTTFQIVHATSGGGLRMDVDLGDEVEQGQPLGTVVDVFGRDVEQLVAPIDGFVLRKMLLGSVGTGAEIAWIGR